ncbi:hypothetical protein AeMF1_017176 [Aphanomyces euteiches]|nr:hypothetical protein AeMF1_017176 [Aphanomyces euteiches]
MQAHEEDDDDLDEWKLDAAPVGLSSNNGPRLHVLALEPLQRFGGSADGTDAATSFLRRFEENAAASGWTDDEAKRKFRLTVSRTVQDWYNQLRADERSTWKALRASFVREYILSPVPKQEVYYTMRQKENETIREYLFRFNAAATKIGLKYDTVRKHFVDHLRCFCNSLADPSQAKWISSMRFASIDDLKEYLNDQRHTEALREHRSQRGATQPGSNQRQERTKAPRVNHLDAVTPTDMAKLTAEATDSVRAEIFALGLNNHEARREVCRDCGKTHFKLDGLCCVEEAIKNEDRTENRRDPDAANHVGFLKVPPVTRNTSNLASKPFVFYSAIDYATLSGEYGLKEGEHFGHWQDTTFIENDMNRQAFLNAQIMDQAVVVLADTGANMSIIHPSIVKKLGLKVDTTKTTDISGLGGVAVVNTQGIVDIKLTIGRGLVYAFPIAVCDFGNTGFDAILGMDFLFRAGVMVDASRRELNLPEGEYVELHDQPVRYSRGYMNYVRLNRDVNIPPGGSVVVPLPKLREGMPETLEYWVHREVRWITTALNSENKPAAYEVTNVSERNVFLSAHTVVGAISAQGERPLDRPMVRTSSLRYQAWKAEAWEGSYPDDYRAKLDEAAAESVDDGSWKEPRPPSPRHLLTADGELRETCETDDDRSEGDGQSFVDQCDHGMVCLIFRAPKRVNRDILSVTRAMLAESRLNETEWDYLLPVVQANLNQTPTESLGEPTTPLNVVVGRVNRKLHTDGLHELNMEKTSIKNSMRNLNKSLQELHKKILDRKRAAQNRNMQLKTNKSELNVSEGDYVLWSRVDENAHYPKLLVTWIGPYRVLECLPYSCVIEHLLTGKTQEAHHSRLKFYADEHLDLTEEILDHVSLQGITLAVDAFEAARYNPGSNQWELKTHWKGLESIESSWEALPKLYGEVQGLDKGFIDELQDEDQRRALLEAVKFLGYPPDVLCPLALGRGRTKYPGRIRRAWPWGVCCVR